MKDVDKISGGIDVWTENQDSNQSEAVCVKMNRNAIPPTDTNTVTPDENQFSDRPNLLITMIDPLSREQLKCSLPNTWAFLELLGLVDFSHYTTVGNNSGPHQAALYLGMPLSDHQDIHKSDNNSTRIWFWDLLNAAGYMTMKVQNGCISNQTHYGKQLNNLFCFSYD